MTRWRTPSWIITSRAMIPRGRWATISTSLFTIRQFHSYWQPHVFSHLALRQHRLHLGIFKFNKSKAGRVSSNPHTSEWSTIAKTSFHFSLVTVVSKITYINLTIQWTGVMMFFEILNQGHGGLNPHTIRLLFCFPPPGSHRYRPLPGIHEMT